MKLITYLRNKLSKFIKNHIVDECPKEYDDLF